MSHLTQVTDRGSTYSFTFDNMGRLIGTTTNYAFLTGRHLTTGYGYDAASNRTSFTDPENGSTSYVYDTLNRLQTLTPPAAYGAGNFGFGYDALSRRTSLTRPNSVTTTYGYDNLSHLLSTLHQLSGSTIDGATYVPDNAGNRTSKTDKHANVTSNYGYDAIYELKTVTQGTNTTESYTYDPVGNRLSSLDVPSYVYNSSNQMTSEGTTTVTYDNNGSPTQTTIPGVGTATLSWDFENRLISTTLPGPTGGTVTFKYDPFGRRIQKASPEASIYLYDGDNLIEEVNSTGAVVARYAQTQNIDEPLAMLRSGATSFYEADGLGSITSLTASNGAIANTYTYDSFGNLTASTGSLTNPFQYTGREFDTETGLYFYRARYYDPNAGRFLREDPIGFRGGINKYTYVSNSATNFIDPWGFCEDSPWNRAKRLLQCAGTLSQAGSLNAILPIKVPLLGGNVFGDLAGAALGPGDFGERVDQGVGVATEGALHVAAVAVPKLAVGAASSIGLPVSSVSGVYNPITIGESTITLGGSIPEVAALSTVIEVVGIAKLGADAVVFAAALAICKFD